MQSEKRRDAKHKKGNKATRKRKVSVSENMFKFTIRHLLFVITKYKYKYKDYKCSRRKGGTPKPGGRFSKC